MTDDRAVSPVFAYVLTLAIAALLTGGLIVAAGSYVSDQREQTGESELQVLGQQVSADIAAADRLVRSSNDPDVRVHRSLPSSVVGSEFQISIVDGPDGPTDPYLELTMTDLDVTVHVGLAVDTPVGESTVGGGDVVVEYDDDDGELVIRND